MFYAQPSCQIFKNSLYNGNNRNDTITLKLCHDVGAEDRFIAIFVHPFRPIRYMFPNRSKVHNMARLIYIYSKMKVIKQNTDPVLVYTF